MTTSQLNIVEIFHCHLGAKGQIGQRLSRAGPAFVEIDVPVFRGLQLLSHAKCPQAPRLLEIKKLYYICFDTPKKNPTKTKTKK